MAEEGTGSGNTVSGGEGGGGSTPPAMIELPSRGRVQAALGCAERAAEAEAQVKVLEAEVAQLKSALAAAQAAFSQLEQRHRLARALEAAGAIDIDTAVLLAELALTDANGPPEAVVESLRSTKPFLFKDAARNGAASPWPAALSLSAAMAAHTTKGAGALTQAAEDAALTGDRAALLRYLQLRRQA